MKVRDLIHSKAFQESDGNEPIEINKIYQGDSVSLLDSVPDKTFDLVCTDPPYRVTSRGGSGTMGGYWRDKETMSGKIFETNSVEVEDYLGKLYRVLKDDAHCYIMCNNKNLPHFMEEVKKSHFHFVKMLVWDKQSKICGRYYMGQVEFIMFLRKGKDKPINECGTSDLLSFPIPSNKRKDKDGLINPTEKPVRLFEVLISNSTKKGDLVLDPFSGSGTTARACVNLERNFVGFDIDKRQVDFVNKEISMMNRQLSLF